MGLSNISRRGWLSIVITLICLLSATIFFVSYYGIEYSQPVPQMARMKIALALTIIVVGGGIGSFYAILFRNKILNPTSEIEPDSGEDVYED